MTSPIGGPSIKGGSEQVRMLLLTFVAIGISFTWRIEMAYCTPYLLELGISKSGTSLVWLAGPFSGMVMQPIVGVLSDASTSPWGRRRPFMVMGSLIVALSFLTLGFSRDLVTVFFADVNLAKLVATALAVVSIWSIDLSVNAGAIVMSCARSLVVDVLPIDQQQEGSSWYNRLYATADVLGNSLGAVDLVSVFGTALGDSQFKQVTVVAACTIVFTTLVTCWAVTERAMVPSRHSERPSGISAIMAAVREIITTMRCLPPRIETICHVQFWAWMGWFPFLYYSSTWVGELYFKYDSPDKSRSSSEMLSEMGRIGSSALMYYAVMALVGSWLAPLLIQSPEDEAVEERGPSSSGETNRLKPDLLAAWLMGNLGFTVAMIFAPFAKSFMFATILIGICGIPWTLHHWAPIAFLGVEVNRMSGSHNTPGSRRRRVSNASEMELEALAPSPEHTALAEAPREQGLELSGIYFGILNIYVTIPQVIGNMFCYVVFILLEPAKAVEPPGVDPSVLKQDGPNAIGVCFFIGALCTLQASRTTRKLRHLRPDGTLTARP